MLGKLLQLSKYVRLALLFIGRLLHVRREMIGDRSLVTADMREWNGTSIILPPDPDRHIYALQVSLVPTPLANGAFNSCHACC